MFQAIRNGARAFLMSLSGVDNSNSVYVVLSEEEKRRTLIEMSKSPYWQEQLNIAKSTSFSSAFEATSLSSNLEVVQVRSVIRQFLISLEETKHEFYSSN